MSSLPWFITETSADEQVNIDAGKLFETFSIIGTHLFLESDTDKTAKEMRCYCEVLR